LVAVIPQLPADVYVSTPVVKPTEHHAPAEVTLYVSAPLPDQPPATSVVKLSHDGVYVTV
jgi:hypothetical protein